MAIEPIRPADTRSLPAATPSRKPPPLPAPPALPMLRFGLRQLFWIVTGLSLLCAAAVMNRHGPTPLLILLAVSVVAAHVAATAIGCQLRRHADESRAWGAMNDAGTTCERDAAEHSCNLATTTLPPPSPWYRRGSTSLRWLPKWVGGGAILGGCIGIALFLTDTIGSRASLAGIVVGAISLAVVGGWFAFVSGSFYAIFRHGLRDAMAQQRNDESRTIPHR